MGASGQQTAGAGLGPSPAAAPAAGDTFSERPELFVGAAFVAGIALAQALRLLGR